MKNFTVIFMAPAEVMAEWMMKPEVERKTEEEKMKKDWDTWMSAHADMVLNTIALGKTKRISTSGVEDVKNDMMLSSYVQGSRLQPWRTLLKTILTLVFPEPLLK
ncbi:MAG: hypothetical protein R3B53_02515 [Candidatus Paceibacterota bacterium]